jgi:hypothetical protein
MQLAYGGGAADARGVGTGALLAGRLARPRAVGRLLKDSLPHVMDEVPGVKRPQKPVVFPPGKSLGGLFPRPDGVSFTASRRQLQGQLDQAVPAAGELSAILEHGTTFAQSDRLSSALESVQGPSRVRSAVIEGSWCASCRLLISKGFSFYVPEDLRGEPALVLHVC